MLNKTLKILILFLSLICSSFNNQDRGQFTYVYFKTPTLQIKYMREGLLCSGFYKGKYRTDFIQKLSSKKIIALQDYILRAKLWTMDSLYKNKNVILDGVWCVFILCDEREEQFKRIFYYECFNRSLDSLMIYLNDLIPDSKKKYYSLDKYRFIYRQDDCICE